MTAVSKGHAFEREVKRLFTDLGWGCMRGAGSKSGVKGKNHADLIAFARSLDDGRTPVYVVFRAAGYVIGENTSQKPFVRLASRITARNIRHVYYSVVDSGTCLSEGWTVVLMQCKINRKRAVK